MEFLNKHTRAIIVFLVVAIIARKKEHPAFDSKFIYFAKVEVNMSFLLIKRFNFVPLPYLLLGPILPANYSVLMPICLKGNNI